MFWQIKIAECDQKFHGVIHKGDTFVNTRVCFGHKPSSPIADLSMVKMAQSGKESHPLGSKALLFKRYIDDMLNSSSKIEVLIQTRDEIDKLIGKFGFNVKEWISNHSEIGTVKKCRRFLESITT